MMIEPVQRCGRAVETIGSKKFQNDEAGLIVERSFQHHAYEKPEAGFKD
ncbi:hypothetical protein ACFFGF_06530 [Asaia lannensis]|uniref:Uncharacterized protein n=1 Tax=Asaia lannensis NBRC 102526 TaxID=1307926 RepID=A0ABT1CFY5_9PROT|nr:hypothetical protein [Asaia lannensis]MCO6159791.1 hypothetical protein [Asaia lannensis NBRC 102526]